MSRATQQYYCFGSRWAFRRFKIWCAEVHSNDYIRFLCTRNTGPLTYEADTMYYFYAVDHAGMKASPIATTAETAESLAFAEEEVALFPEILCI